MKVSARFFSMEFLTHDFTIATGFHFLNSAASVGSFMVPSMKPSLSFASNAVLTAKLHEMKLLPTSGRKQASIFGGAKAKSKKGRRSVTLLDIKLTDRPIQLGVANEQNCEANRQQSQLRSQPATEPNEASCGVNEANRQRSQTEPVAEPTGNGASCGANRQRSQTEPVAGPTGNRASYGANRQRSQTKPVAEPTGNKASCGANRQRSQMRPVAEPTGNRASYEANRQWSQTEPAAEPHTPFGGDHGSS
ncbi:histone-lysine N-methyltransferase 2C-like isoform X1 [Senna tora]|uniref:Histone-lysine N-methyltransferase 2C-like isoform X1 n=1 Tax=Senna tora TaxID=362788 RepID=A0A834SZE0_9FABA|nr:histone-lysine N-methyltransferase 2C-like isoform X1 [Senna tora]